MFKILLIATLIHFSMEENAVKLTLNSSGNSLTITSAVFTEGESNLNKDDEITITGSIDSANSNWCKELCGKIEGFDKERGDGNDNEYTCSCYPENGIKITNECTLSSNNGSAKFSCRDNSKVRVLV